MPARNELSRTGWDALRRTLARKRSESGLQATVLAVLRAHGLLCWKMNREKAGGQRGAHHVGFAGIPDLAGVVSPHGRAFFVEVKRPGALLRPTQRAAAALLRQSGALVFNVSSVDEARAVAGALLRGAQR